MLSRTLKPLPISQYHCVTMAAISGIYSKCAYSSRLQHRSLVKIQPCGSQTFMSRGPLLSLTDEYLIYRDTCVMQYHGKATWWRPLWPPDNRLWPPDNRSAAPKRSRGPRLRNPRPALPFVAGIFKLIPAVP